MRKLKRYVTAAALGLASGAAAQGIAPDDGTDPWPDVMPEPAPDTQGPSLLDSEDLGELLERLGEPDADHERIAARITALWARSGSAAVDLLLRRADEAMQEGEAERAVDHLTAALDHAPGFVEAWHLRATAHYEAGRAGEALDDLARALDLEPRHFGALAGVGFIMQEMGFDDGALGAFRAAAAIHPAVEPVNRAIEDLERAAEGEAL